MNDEFEQHPALSAEDPNYASLEASAPEPPTLRRLLVGDDGLRAGWSMLVFLIVLAIFGTLSALIVNRFHLLPRHPQASVAPMSPLGTILTDGITFVVLTLASLAMAGIEGRPFRRYGLTSRHMLPDFVIGLFWGFACLSLLIGALLLSHALAFDGVALHGRTAVAYGSRWLVAFFLVGLAEEFLTRGYIQFTVARGVAGITRALDPDNRHAHVWGFWVAALLFSVCFFMAGHLGNPGETLPGILAVGLAGAVFAYSLWRTGSLWWAIGFHTAWDWAQTYFYGVHDSGLAAQGHLLTTHPIGAVLLSGGNTGPEGSVLVLPTLLLVGLIIHVTLPRRDYFLTPDQRAPGSIPLTTETSI